MHFRRSRTNRRINKRAENKRARAAEAAALQGAPPKVVRTGWPAHPVQPPLLDSGRTRAGGAAKPRPRKERCPVNRKHECLTEEREVEVPHWFPFRRDIEIKIVRYKMCVHCGKEWTWGYGVLKGNRPRKGWRAVR